MCFSPVVHVLLIPFLWHFLRSPTWVQYRAGAATAGPGQRVDADYPLVQRHLA